MSILSEFLIIIITAITGTVLANIPGFPLPGTVTGMILMLLLLLTKIISLNHVKRTADFLLALLPLFFVPLVVNIVNEKKILSEYGIKILIIVFITTIITISITGLTTKLLLFLYNKRKDKNV
ncbi:MAG: CidA/LrgA family protein [Spirochaetales bacterium]|nr:CidA/LrgA family protein [Spirochaetales bacterium]